MGPAYLGCSLILLLMGRRPYRDNPFERGVRERGWRVKIASWLKAINRYGAVRVCLGGAIAVSGHARRKPVPS